MAGVMYGMVGAMCDAWLVAAWHLVNINSLFVTLLTQASDEPQGYGLSYNSAHTSP